MSTHMKSLEATTHQLRQIEQATRSELSTTAASFSELKVTNEAQEKKIEELEEKVERVEKDLEKYQQKLGEIKERCNRLTEQAEEERNKRLFHFPFLTNFIEGWNLKDCGMKIKKKEKKNQLEFLIYWQNQLKPRQDRTNQRC
jgi:septal ring factor EnvC (AmiA/AmiB activator)